MNGRNCPFLIRESMKWGMKWGRKTVTYGVQELAGGNGVRNRAASPCNEQQWICSSVLYRAVKRAETRGLVQG
jgi:hypothetical protein